MTHQRGNKGVKCGIKTRIVPQENDEMIKNIDSLGHVIVVMCIYEDPKMYK